MRAREDEGMAFMLQYENVAWYESGQVRILDRRVYPSKVEFVCCHTYTEVAQAIKDMVTQSAGPYTAAGMGMALAAYECQDKPYKEQWEYLEMAAHTISHARPTTANRMQQVTNGCLKAAQQAYDQDENVVKAIFNRTVDSLNRRYHTMGLVGEYLAELFPFQGTILTQCFGETIIGTMLRAARQKNNPIRIICAETRPYLQGARLTATCCEQMGFDTTVVTDNMIAYVMEREKVDLFTSAADTIARDGYIANKIGTLQMAILAKYYHLPYFVTGIPDQDKVSGKEIVIEKRDPALVLECHGIKHTAPGVKGLYPSFDIVPPHLISGIVTDQGVYCPYTLEEYFRKPIQEFY